MPNGFGVIQEASDGVLIIGINRASRHIAKYLKEHNRHVVLIDNNGNSVETAKAEGLEAFQENIYNNELGDNMELLDVGLFACDD